MREILRLAAADVETKREAVFETQGIRRGNALSDRIEALVTEAYDLNRALAEPIGVLAEVEKDDFAGIFEGEGNNEAETPLAAIWPEATHLALYAVTLGEPVCRRITDLFESAEFALGSMLDSVASAAADRTAVLFEERFQEYLAAEAGIDAATRTLGYSPGYCGWHITAQRRHPQ